MPVSAHFVLDQLLRTLVEHFDKVNKRTNDDGSVIFDCPNKVSGTFEGPPGVQMRLSLELLNIPGFAIPGSEKAAIKGVGMDDKFVFDILAAADRLEAAGMSREQILGRLAQ